MRQAASARRELQDRMIGACRHGICVIGAPIVTSGRREVASSVIGVKRCGCVPICHDERSISAQRQVGHTSVKFDTDNNGAPQVVATQVKEKLGALRFHVIGSEPNDVQRGMIWFAEAMSGRICEICGKPGKMVELDRYISTRCPEHSKSPGNE